MNFLEVQMYKIYCDGATSNNKKGEGIGGCGWVILKDDEKINEGAMHLEGTTNNECELKAMINGYLQLSPIITSLDEVEFYTDSAYIHNCFSQGWWKKWIVNGWINSKKQPVANKELWELIIPLFNNKQFSFHKVKGHNGDLWNEYVDKLAVSAKLMKT